ncbi:imidazole glycerol phosphate synthase subunit HisH [Mesoflavibacter zeaxanthinifaciens]|uniref:imidazole glycerol phosphate synthase subunit HisH n=1 Tax=Mesoflavibacter zeaxanthinifaciens TaxID=393060 RepID=UPI003A932BDF
MITIVDYGSGNINAITNIYELLKIPFSIASKPSELELAEKIILPGVGSFDYCMAKLNNSGLKDVLNKRVLKDKVPVLGICIGLHIMALNSEEGELPGLGWIEGIVKRFDETKLIEKPKIPHMGWNSIKVESIPKLFKDINQDQGFYFIHSYYIDVKNKENIMTTTNYGSNFVSSVTSSSNIYAVQFHPEKSHSNGMKLLKNFSDL